MVAWSQDGISLNVWEKETFKQLSQEYLTTYTKLEKSGHPPPYMTEANAEKLRKQHALTRRAQLQQMQRTKNKDA